MKRRVRADSPGESGDEWERRSVEHRDALSDDDRAPDMAKRTRESTPRTQPDATTVSAMLDQPQIVAPADSGASTTPIEQLSSRGLHSEIQGREPLGEDSCVETDAGSLNNVASSIDQASAVSAESTDQGKGKGKRRAIDERPTLDEEPMPQALRSTSTHTAGVSNADDETVAHRAWREVNGQAGHPQGTSLSVDRAPTDLDAINAFVEPEDCALAVEAHSSGPALVGGEMRSAAFGEASKMAEADDDDDFEFPSIVDADPDV